MYIETTYISYRDRHLFGLWVHNILLKFFSEFSLFRGPLAWQKETELHVTAEYYPGRPPNRSDPGSEEEVEIIDCITALTHEPYKLTLEEQEEAEEMLKEEGRKEYFWLAENEL